MLSSRFSRNNELSKNYLFRMFDERHRVRVFLGQDDSLQFNNTWNTQIDHQDGDSVLEIIGLLLSIANIAVGESCENSHSCCLCLNVCICVLLLLYVCVCMCVYTRVTRARECVISPPTRFININKYRCKVMCVCVCYMCCLQ